LFWLYVCNTAIVFVIQIDPAKIGVLSKVVGNTPEIVDFSADWYNIVGTSIILVQLFMPFTNQGYMLFYYFRKKALIKLASAPNSMVAVSQQELNEIFLGPTFKLSSRYAMQVAILFVCYIFSMGIPLLPMIACFNFYVVYLVDKFLFVNYYRVPARYDTSISTGASKFIPIAAVIHLIFSIWTLSSRSIFATTDSSNSVVDSSSEAAGQAHNSFVSNVWASCTTEQALPLFGLLVVLVFALLVEFIANWFFGSVGQLFVYLFGNLCSKWEYMKEMEAYYEKEKQKKNFSVTYTRCKERGILRGLTTYNMLENPFYMDKFAITKEYAQLHTIRSLKLTNYTKEQSNVKTTMVNVQALRPVKKVKQVAKKKEPEKKKEAPKLERMSSEMQREAVIRRELGEE
jgi:hypothetical protein